MCATVGALGMETAHNAATTLISPLPAMLLFFLLLVKNITLLLLLFFLAL
jgi:hypothetical protein